MRKKALYVQLMIQKLVLTGWPIKNDIVLRLEPSITEFGVRMTDLLQTSFFHLIYGKINPKNLGKVIKNLKNLKNIFFLV